MRPRPALVLVACGALVAALLPTAAAQAVSSAPAHCTGTLRFAGTPQANTTVGWFDPHTDDEQTVRTGADGAFDLTLPSPGHGFVIFAGLPHASGANDSEDDLGLPPSEVPGAVGVYYGANGPDYAYQTRTWYTGGVSLTQDIDLPAAGVLTGTSADLAAEHVDLRNLNGDTVGTTTADSSGSFSFQVVPGRFRLRVERDDAHLGWTSPVQTVTAATTTTVPVARTVGATVSGTVRHSGAVASGVVVSAGGRTTRTGPTGTYRLTGLPLGTVAVHVGTIGTASAHSAYVPQSHVLSGLTSGATRHLDVSVAAGAVISGTYDSGSDADRYIAVVTRRTAGGSVVTGDERAAHVTTSKNPVYASGLAAGTYVIRVYDENGSRYAQRTVTLKAGASAKLGLLKPTSRTVSLQGDLHGASSGSVIAMATNQSAGGFAMASGGHYAIFGLLPGSYAVYFSPSNRVTTKVTVSVPKSARHDLSAGARLGAFDATITIGGHVTDGVDIYEDLAPSTSDPFDPAGAGALEGEDDGSGLTTGDGAAGVHHIDEVDPWSPPFQANSPFWYAWPSGRTISLTSGTTKHLGTIALTLQGTTATYAAAPAPVSDPTPNPTDSTTPPVDPAPTDSTTPPVDPAPTDSTTPPVDPAPTDSTTPPVDPAPTDSTTPPAG